MDFFFPSDPVFNFSPPKHPEQLYSELPTKCADLVEWARDYYFLLVQAYRVRDEARVHLAQQALYHVQYRLIKAKVYYESSNFVEQYEQQLPNMVWHPKSVSNLPTMNASETSVFELFAMTSAFRDEPLENSHPDTVELQVPEPSVTTQPEVEGDPEDQPSIDEEPRSPSYLPDEPAPLDIQVVQDCAVQEPTPVVDAPVASESRRASRRRRRGRGSRQKALKRYLLNKVPSESPPLSDLTFSEFEEQLSDTRDWNIVPMSQRKTQKSSIRGRRVLTAREEETRKVFQRHWDSASGVMQTPELKKGALSALTSISGVQFLCGRDFVLYDRNIKCDQQFDTSRDWGPLVSSDLQEYLGSSRFSAYYY